MIFAIARALIPSWRFFDRVGTQLHLEYRNGASEEWGNALPAPESSLFPLFVNHARNAHLARHAILERFVDEARRLDSADKTSSLVSHVLLRNIVRAAGGSAEARFRILARHPDGSSEQIYESDAIGGS